MAKIVDPDGLALTTDVIIDTTGKTIQIVTTGGVSNASPGSTSGVTLQALYSFLKEEWKTGATLNKFKFPLKMFTKTDGIFINGWDFLDATSRNVIRDAGWEEITGDQYAGIVSLGNFDATGDQAWYQHVIGYDAVPINFNKTGNLNEAIQIDTFTGYLKAFLRIASGSGTGKLYSEYNLLTEQTISALEPVLYKLPLSNSTDLKINIADATIDGSTPYTNMKVNYLKGALFVTATAISYALADVVKDGVGRWAFCTGAGSVATPGNGYATFGGTSTWQAYDGEVLIGTTYYAFNRLITGGNGTAQQIYNWAQRQLRKTTDINANDSPTAGQRSGLTVKGNVAEMLLEFVGDTLKTKPGLYISGFHADSTNSIKFRDITVDGGGVDANTYLPVTSTERNYPFVATGALNFSANLITETDADTKYTMYFTSTPSGNFDTANAIIVKDNTGTDITGTITPDTGSQINFDFDYDGNVQGGRTAGTDAAVSIVAQGLPLATWVLTTFTITRATGQSITINADDERNYANP